MAKSSTESYTTIPDRYKLSDEEKAELKSEAKATGRTPNPIANRKGAYWGAVEALIQLGPNQWHSLKEVCDMMEQVMSQIEKVKTIKQKDGKKEKIQTNAWKDFATKEGRDTANAPKDHYGRIEQNMRVLQRLPKPHKSENNPYGLKLAQMGMCVDIDYRIIEEGVPPVPYIKLNTEWEEDPTGHTVEPQRLTLAKKRKLEKQQEKEQKAAEKPQDSEDSQEEAQPSAEAEAAEEATQPQETKASESDDEPLEVQAEVNDEYEDDEPETPIIYFDRYGGDDEKDGRSPEESVASVRRIKELADGRHVQLRDPDDNILPNDLLNEDEDELESSAVGGDTEGEPGEEGV